MKKRVNIIFFAFFFTVAILTVGYLSFGLWTTVILTSGFLGGFTLWLVMPMHISFADIRKPFWTTFLFFILHRVEENVFRFQEELSKITKLPVPGFSWALVFLVLASVGGWLLILILIKRKNQFGYYLIWTFFAAMGITELAHFIFPFLTGKPYGYFPGMLSAVLLVPAAWWGIYRLTKKPFYEYRQELNMKSLSQKNRV